MMNGSCDASLFLPSYCQYYRFTYINKLDDSLKGQHSERGIWILGIFMKYI